jgi:hypothetical protein
VGLLELADLPFGRPEVERVVPARQRAPSHWAPQRNMAGGGWHGNCPQGKGQGGGPRNGFLRGPRRPNWLPDTPALTLKVHSMIVRADRAGAQGNARTGRGFSAWGARYY